MNPALDGASSPQASPVSSMKVTAVRSTRMVGPRWLARSLCKHSSNTPTHGPANFPSSWNVRASGLSWTVIRNITHTVSCVCPHAVKAGAVPARLPPLRYFARHGSVSCCAYSDTRRSGEQSGSATREAPLRERWRRRGGATRAIQFKQQSMHRKVPFLSRPASPVAPPGRTHVHASISSRAGNLEKLHPAGDAEIPDRVEPIPLEGQADLFDRHVRLRVEVDDLPDTGFSRSQHLIRGHEPNAAGDPVELHERIGAFE